MSYIFQQLSSMYGPGAAAPGQPNLYGSAMPTASGMLAGMHACVNIVFYCNMLLLHKNWIVNIKLNNCLIIVITYLIGRNLQIPKLFSNFIDQIWVEERGACPPPIFQVFILWPSHFHNDSPPPL